MKCRYTFPIKAPLVRIEIDGFNFKSRKKLYEFNKSKKPPSQFELSVTISDFPIGLRPTISMPTSGPSKASINIPDDPFWEDLVSEVRTIEGALCIWGVEEINTDECRIEWQPDNDSEKGMMQIFSFSRARDNSPPPNIPFSPLDLFVRSILVAPELQNIEVPLNFYRCGRQDVYDERYIEAIYDLYFVIEYLFAEGKFKKNDVVESFSISDELVNVINVVKAAVDSQIALETRLLHEFKVNYQDKSVKEVIYHIVNFRGRLHHFNTKRANIWHPARQRDYKVDAIILLQICHHILSNRTMKILFSDEHMATFLQTEVRTNDGKKFQWNPRA